MAYTTTKVTRPQADESQDAASNSAGQSQTGQQSGVRTIPIPFAGLPTQRGVGTGDQRYVNIIFEKEENPLSGGTLITCRKRPGVSSVNQPPAGAATGRGLFAWQATGAIYSVFDDKLYKGTTDMGVTLAGTTGKVWWAHSPATSTTQYLFMSDGADLYLIETDDTVTQIDENDDAEWPTSNLGPVCFFDDYIFLAQSDGEIWNSDVDAPTAWTSTGVISASGYGDDLEAIVRMKEQIVALGKSSIQMFYDNATTGSPLARVEQNAFQVGCVSKNTVALSGETLVWVGSSEEGGDMNRQVWLMEGLTKFKSVSTKVIERFLAEEGTNISNASCWMERVDGHLLYVLNLITTASRTFVYDVDMDMWSEWQVAGASTEITWNAATSLNGETYVQDVASGRILKFADTVYQDNGTNFTVTIQTDRFNFGTPMCKFQNRLWIEGDTTSSSSNLAVSVTDDDYASFNTARNIDMSLIRKFLPQWGRFYERAYKFTYTDNYPLRLRQFWVDLEEGTM